MHSKNSHVFNTLGKLHFISCKSHLCCNFVSVLCLVYLHATMSLEATDSSAASSDDGNLAKRFHMDLHYDSATYRSSGFSL